MSIYILLDPWEHTYFGCLRLHVLKATFWSNYGGGGGLFLSEDTCQILLVWWLDIINYYCSQFNPIKHFPLISLCPLCRKPPILDKFLPCHTFILTDINSNLWFFSYFMWNIHYRHPHLSVYKTPGVYELNFCFGLSLLNACGIVNC